MNIRSPYNPLEPRDADPEAAEQEAGLATPLSDFETQRFSNVGDRDGFGMELIERASQRVVAEVFASDLKDAAFTLTTFGAAIPVVVIEWFITSAREGIGTYTDGRALPSPSGSQSG